MISCTSCHSKYLVNSADLKPIGRNVQCAKCGNQWFQEVIKNEKDENLSQLEDFKYDNINFEAKEKSESSNNLPSTYVKASKVSFLNSFLVLLFTFTLLVSFWSLKNFEINTLVLIKYYISEFYFNLNLIFNDIAKVIHKIIN